MDCCNNRLPLPVTRRELLRTLACGFGYMAFAGLASAERFVGNGAPGAARAKRIIFLCMTGGPSHVDTFDHKPQLLVDDGRALGAGIRRGAKLLASPWTFRPRGESGLEISDLFPELSSHADDLCLLRGMKTAVPAHPQAQMMLHTGSFQFVRPSMGAWTLYGLGTENRNLPGFVTVNPGGTASHHGSAFLPAITQGVPVRSGGRGEPIRNVRNARVATATQRKQLDLAQRLNRRHGDAPEVAPVDRDAIEGVIENYELAFRMQAEVPELVDLSAESAATLARYGIDAGAGEPRDGFARQCLLARRFAERGVRFIQVNHGGWDTHRNLREDLERQCGEIDRPIAALLGDLKERGLLKDTLVIWGGEFGRTPYAQNGDGRDHNNKGFTIWMAGGGVRGGFSYGATDEYGIEAIDGIMDIHDWHATVLHLLGLDHERLTYRHAGRDYRLTDVKGRVVGEIVA